MAAPKLGLNGQQSNPVFSDENLSDFTSIPQLIAFSAKDFVYWWYVQMPVWYVLSLRRIATVIDDQFSLSLLIKTFHIPWHRDYTFPGYMIGILVRIIYIPIAAIVFLTVVSADILFIMLWFFLPIITVGMIILSPILRLT
jgi:hypothetical protein